MRLKRENTNVENTGRLHKDDGKIKPTRHYSSRQEKSIASAVNGHKVANSGATAYNKGDVTSGDRKGWLFEAKTCVKEQKTFTMREEWFTKNREESLLMKKDYTAVVFNFGPDKPNYYCVDERTFLEMKNALDEINNQ